MLCLTLLVVGVLFTLCMHTDLFTFRCVWTSESSRLQGLGHTRHHGFPLMTSRNPRAMNVGSKHRTGMRGWMSVMLPVHLLKTVPILQIYRLMSSTLKWDRLSGLKVNESRSCYVTFSLLHFGWSFLIHLLYGTLSKWPTLIPVKLAYDHVTPLTASCYVTSSVFITDFCYENSPVAGYNCRQYSVCLFT